MSQDYTDGKKAGYSPAQSAAISAVDATLKAAKLPTYSELEEKLYQTLTACAESIEMGKKLYHELAKKKGTSDSNTISRADLPEFKKMYDQAVKDGKEVFMFKGSEVLVSYAKYAIEYLEMLKN